METTAVLAELLAENRTYSDTYRFGLSNHASMALPALARLGASEERMRAFWAHERQMLEPLDPNGPEAAVRARFAAALRRDGRERVLRDALPRLIDGVGAAAFHGVLRTAYALDADDDAELACGLAHWERSYLDLGTSTARATDVVGVAEAYDRARALLRDRAFAGDLIAERMAVVAHDTAFDDAARIAWRPEAFDELARFTSMMFAATRDFTALHAMTGTHALRALLPYVDEAAAFRAQWRALVAGYATVGFPARPDDAESADVRVDVVPWETIVAAALASDDDHVIKVVDTCVRDFARRRDVTAQAATTRWLRRKAVIA